MTGDAAAPPPTGRRRRPWLRIGLAATALIVVLLVGGSALLVARLDPNEVKPRIADAVRQATGREVSLNGPIGVKLSLLPIVQATDLSLANPAGFSRPAMATLSQIEARLSLLGLLRGAVVIDSVTLVQPDILLEVNARGERNWDVARPAPPPAASPAPSQTEAAETAAPSGGRRVHIGAVTIRDGRLAYRNAVTGRSLAMTLPTLTLSAADGDAPILLTAEAAVNGTPVAIKAQTGSLAALQNEVANRPWPVLVTVTSGAATMKIEGALAHPLAGSGYSVAISADIPDLPALTPLTFGTALPPVRNVAVTAKIAEGSGGLPAISDLTLRAGGADLTRWAAGLHLDRLEVVAPAMDQPMKIDMAGTWDRTGLAVAGTIGQPASFRSGGAPWPLDLRIEAGGAQATVKGTLADPLTQTGVALDVAGQIPDLAALSTLARRPLPALRTIAFQAHVTDGPGGLTHGVAVSGLRLTMPEGDLSGSLRYADGVPITVAADLSATRLDADALLAAVRAAAPQPAPAPASTPTPSNGGAPAAAAPKPAANGRLFSDTPLPFGLLQRADADIRVQIAMLRINGGDTKALRTHLVLKDGRLRIDPFTADTPDGRVTATLTADATVPAPPVALTAHAPGLALRPLLTSLGVAPFASGRLEVYADLRGAGETPRALAASLSGYLGLAMEGGTLDTKLIGGQLGRASTDFQILDLMGRGGGNGEVRCAATRFEARDGVAHARTLVLSSNLLTADGGGSVNLRDETLDLLLRPQGRMGGTGFRIPVRVSGSLRAPKAAVDPSGAAEANAGSLAGIIIGRTIPESLFGGLLGADRLPMSGGSLCPAALAVARGGAAPAAAAPSPAPQQPTPQQPTPALPKLPDPGNLLRQLFR